MQINVYDLTGRISGKASLPEKFFAAAINQPLMAQAVKVYLSNQRRGGAKAKSRGEITFSTRKIYRQKGTGRARHGAASAPIFVGGGVAHGPKGTENFKKTLPKKMRQAALASALTTKHKDKEIMVIEGMEKIKGKTKEMSSFLKKLSLGKKVLLVLAGESELVVRAGGNIPDLEIIQGSTLNTYRVLRANKILLTKEAIKLFKEK